MTATQDEDEQPLTPAAQRILDTASELFYTRGINAVGVDTIAAESGVTKRTLYDRFGSKDQLLVTYLRSRDRRWRALVRNHVDRHTNPIRRVIAPFDALPEWIFDSDRGCSFINAFAELPDPAHPGWQVIVDEKTWLRDLFQQLLVEANATEPKTLAVQLLSLHEGAIVSYSIADEPSASTAVRSAAEDLVARAVPG